MPPKKNIRKCKVEGCTKVVKSGGVCHEHGAPIRKCKVEFCDKRVVQGGLCIAHGAKVKKCSFEGCTNQVKRKGVCTKHGAKHGAPPRKRCTAEGCSNFAINGGVCVKHGARHPRCSVQDCTNQARKGGLCQRHSKCEPCEEWGVDQRQSEANNNRFDSSLASDGSVQQIYHELQELWFCGVHALNAILQCRVVTKEIMDQAVDTLITETWKGDERGDLYNEDTGNYDIEVVRKVANTHGLVISHMTKEEKENNLEDNGFPAYFIHKKGECEHYYAICRINNQYWNLDSVLPWPTKISWNEIKGILDDSDTNTGMKVEFKTIANKNGCTSQYPPVVSESEPCRIDSSGKGHWWRIDFLDGLMGDDIKKVTMEVVMKLLQSESAPTYRVIEMDTIDTLMECFKQFHKLSEKIGFNESEKSNFGIRFGDEVIQSYRWKHMPVKLFAGKVVVFVKLIESLRHQLELKNDSAQCAVKEEELTDDEYIVSRWKELESRNECSVKEEELTDDE